MPARSRLEPHDAWIRRAVADRLKDSEIARMLTEALGVAPPVSEKLVWYYRRSRGIATTRRGGAQPGADHRDWKGGRTIDKAGYALILRPDHPEANAAGYVREHRLVAERILGRPLVPGERVHHRDGDRANNEEGNLRVYRSNAEHLRDELTGRRPNWSPEGLQRIREASAAHMATPQAKERIRQIGYTNRGRKASPEARARIADGGRRSWTPERRANAAKRLADRNRGNAGRPLDRDHRQKLSTTVRASWTPERRAAQAARMRERHAARRSGGPLTSVDPGDANPAG